MLRFGVEEGGGEDDVEKVGRTSGKILATPLLKHEKTVHDKLRGERDVIRLGNPTEDKRAFQRMLTSADREAAESESRVQYLSAVLLTGIIFSGAPRVARSASCGRSPIAKVIYPSGKIW